jgi:8-oxo-dGTP pyrophosphatase MutT (NUDIX family)
MALPIFGSSMRGADSDSASLAHEGNWPNLWDVSVAGHISAGEGPVEAALREAQEELGVTLVPGECSHLFTVAEYLSLNNGN